MKHPNLIISYAILTLLDFLTTILCIKYAGTSEGNPIMAFVIASFGFIGFFLAKAMVVAFFVWMDMKFRIGPALGIVNVVLLLVVISNVWLLVF